jgi:hypothetical protein
MQAATTTCSHNLLTCCSSVHQKSGLKGGVAFDWRDLVKGGLLYFFFVMKLLFFYQQEIYGYVGNKVKKVLIWILIFLTVGFLRLLASGHVCVLEVSILFLFLRYFDCGRGIDFVFLQFCDWILDLS